MITIKQAGVADTEKLVEWRIKVMKDVFSIPPGSDMTALEKSNRDYYATELISGGHIACFAYADGKIIGCGGICMQAEMPSPDNPSGRSAYIMNIYVEPAHRKVGAGKAIVAWLVERATKLGVTKIHLESTDKAKPLYSSLGFTDAKNYMIIQIDGDK